MKFVLIIWIIAAGSSGGNTIATAEFNTYDQCEITGKALRLEMKNQVGAMGSVYFYCAKK